MHVGYHFMVTEGQGTTQQVEQPIPLQVEYLEVKFVVEPYHPS